jgi:hypothetical protein
MHRSSSNSLLPRFNEFHILFKNSVLGFGRGPPTVRGCPIPSSLADFTRAPRALSHTCSDPLSQGRFRLALQSRVESISFDPEAAGCACRVKWSRTPSCPESSGPSAQAGAATEVGGECKDAGQGERWMNRALRAEGDSRLEQGATDGGSESSALGQTCSFEEDNFDYVIVTLPLGVLKRSFSGAFATLLPSPCLEIS